jgi:hypothetical protein
MSEIRTTSSTGGQKGVKEQRFDLIPIGPLTELAQHYGRGAKKYDDHQWRNGYEWSKSYAAAQRHMTAFWDGQDYDVCSNDPENCQHVTSTGEPFKTDIPDTCYNHTGGHHLVCAVWHGFTLLEFKDVFPQHDDRFKRSRVETPKIQLREICGNVNGRFACLRPLGHEGDPNMRLHGEGGIFWNNDGL